MDTPLDYPSCATADADALGVEGGDITFAALLDRHAAEEPITDDMIRRACLRMESAHSYPDVESVDDESTTHRLARLLRLAR